MGNRVRTRTSGGRTLPLLGLMLLLWLLTSTLVVTGLPLRLAGAPAGPARPTIFWHDPDPPVAAQAPLLSFSGSPDAVLADHNLLGPSRPLMAAGPEGLWILHAGESGVPGWDGPGSESPGALHLGPSARVLHDGGRTVHIQAPGSGHTASWQIPAGTRLGMVATGAGGVWVNAWQPGPEPYVPATWPHEPQALTPGAAVTENLFFVSLEGRVVHTWTWVDEVLLAIECDRDAAYTMSWSVSTPPSTVIRRLPVGPGDSWQVAVETMSATMIRVPSAGDAVARMVWATEAGHRPGEITTWPGTGMVLIASDDQVLALTPSGEVLFSRHVDGTILDLVQVGEYAAVLNEVPGGQILLYLDRRGRDVARHWAMPGWQGLTPLPWGEAVAWGGNVAATYDSFARQTWTWTFDAPVTAVTAAYGDASGDWGLVAVWTGNGALHLLRVNLKLEN